MNLSLYVMMSKEKFLYYSGDMSSTAASSLLPIVQSQRERYRLRAKELEMVICVLFLHVLFLHVLSQIHRNNRRGLNTPHHVALTNKQE